MSRNEAAKGEIEVKVFERFVRLRDLCITPGSVEKRVPPDPDILCSVEAEGLVGFELTEACAPEFAEAEARVRTRGGSAFVWGRDASINTIRRKLKKSYPVTYPIELILWAGRTALPDDVLQPMVTPLLSGGLGQFRRVWLLGDELSELQP